MSAEYQVPSEYEKAIQKFLLAESWQKRLTFGNCTDQFQKFERRFLAKLAILVKGTVAAKFAKPDMNLCDFGCYNCFARFVSQKSRPPESANPLSQNVDLLKKHFQF